MGKAERLETKIKRLRRIEASYRNEIRRAEAAMSDTAVDRDKAKRKYERVRAKFNYKIEVLAGKVRDLTTKRAQLVK